MARHLVSLALSFAGACASGGPCHGAGTIFGGKDLPDVNCCPGLDHLSVIVVVDDTDGEGITCEDGPVDVVVCGACGDGTCGDGENGCNCPDDCEPGEGDPLLD